MSAAGFTIPGRYTSFNGAALPGVTFNKVVPGANVNCPAGSFTSLTAGQSLACSDPGFYLLAAFGSLYFTTGATPPTDVQFQLASSPNSNTDPHGMAPFPFAANTSYVVPVFSVLTFFNAVVAPNPVFSPGQSVQLQVKPIGQAITVLGSAGPPPGGTQIAVFKFRRDD